jgi:phytoene dehydrogenase-like protein
VRDVVVVGAGHNGLVAACLLAAAGLDVEVVERDTVVGGAVSTVERWPGYRVDRGSSLHVMVRHTRLVEELGLAELGLRYLNVDPWGFLPVPGVPGGGVLLRHDLDATCDGIAEALGPVAAQGYRRFVRTWGPRQRRLLDLLHTAPTTSALARAAWTLGRGEPAHQRGDIGKAWLATASEVLDDLGDERLAAGLAWLAGQSGPAPHEPATAGMLGWVALLHDLPPARPVGGSGRLTETLAARLRLSGGQLRLGDGAAAITRTGGTVDGVLTASGERIRARTVLAACHVQATWKLLGRSHDAARSCDGTGVALRLATRDLPHYPDAKAEAHHGMQLLIADRAELVRAHADAAAGRLPDRPAVLVMTPSATDPTLAPPGRHVVTVWAQWHPHDLRGGWTGEARERTVDGLLDVVEEYAPGFRDGVEHALLQAPPDLERELGLVRGDLMHVAMSVDQMFAARPRPGWSGYRTPVPGLYLAGASTHPGGGVWGASGRSAARTILADRSRRRRLGNRLDVWTGRAAQSAARTMLGPR